MVVRGTEMIGPIASIRLRIPMFDLFRNSRRDRIRSTPFPEEWDALLHQNLAIYRCLREEDRLELQGLIQIFLSEKHFEGCGGLELTDEIRVTIAAQACLLLLGNSTDFFDRLVTILVYPSAYVAKGVEHIGGGLHIEGEHARLGETSQAGVVVLSWEDAQHGAYDSRDGKNVVYHEFAHQLDLSDGAPDGTPRLESWSRYAPWARILGEEFERLKEQDRSSKKTVLDKYGAINPAEFFAVATEAFFEKPRKLREKHPELYAVLHDYFKLDPGEILGGTPRESS